MSAKPEILVVNDNPDAREILVLFLKGVGFQTIEAATSPEALQAAQTAHPDLILSDLALPEISGDEVDSGSENARHTSDRADGSFQRGSHCKADTRMWGRRSVDEAVQL